MVPDWVRHAPRTPFLLTASAALIFLSWTDPSPALAAGCDPCIPGGPTCTLTGCLVYVDEATGDETTRSCYYYCSGSDGVGGDDGGSIWKSNPDGSGSSCVQGCSGTEDPVEVVTDP